MKGTSSALQPVSIPRRKSGLLRTFATLTRSTPINFRRWRKSARSTATKKTAAWWTSVGQPRAPTSIRSKSCWIRSTWQTSRVPSKVESSSKRSSLRCRWCSQTRAWTKNTSQWWRKSSTRTRRWRPVCHQTTWGSVTASGISETWVTCKMNSKESIENIEPRWSALSSRKTRKQLISECRLSENRCATSVSRPAKESNNLPIKRRMPNCVSKSPSSSVCSAPT